MSESPLARAMRYTSSLKYADLRELLACIRYRQGQAQDSISTTEAISVDRYAALEAAINNEADAPATNTLLAAFSAMTRIENTRDLDALAAMVETLVNALQPDQLPDDERGFIELRWVPRLRWNLREGIARVWYGPYAYLRYRSSNRSLYASHYLGRDIADLYSTGQLSVAQLVDAYENNSLDQLKKEAKEQAASIMPDALPAPPQLPAPFNLHAGFIGMVNEGKLKRYEVVKLYTPLILNGLDARVITQDDLYHAYRADTWDDLKNDLKRQLGTDED